MNKRYLIRNEAVRTNCLHDIGELVADDQDYYVVTIKQKTRSAEQNAKLHSMLTDVSKQVIWHGQVFNLEIWKRLLTASWLRERNESPLLVPAIDGNGVDIIYQKTSSLTIPQCAELIEYIYAFGAEHNVTWGDVRNYRE